MLSKTDASETALRFCRALDEPAAGTSASHLRIVQEAVRDFAVAVNPDLDERIAQFEQRQQEIQHSIDDLCAGVSVELSETEQRERIHKIYQLASVLDGDGKARLIALMGSEPSPGQSRWTLHTLRDRLIELEVVESTSHESVRQVLKKQLETLV